MANKSRLDIAKKDIEKIMSSQELLVFSRKDISIILKENREDWRLAINTNLSKFIDYLCQKSKLKRVKFEFPNRSIIGYTWGEIDSMLVLMCLIDNSFYSHYTAMRIHGLTEQIPKTIYISVEKKSPTHNPDNLSQEAIDSAFQKQPRATQNIVELSDGKSRVAFLQSAYHEEIGLEDIRIVTKNPEGIPIRCTSLERTMIDIAIRPFYAGGVAEVMKAFENAKGLLKVNKMSAMLKKMKFLYPYHQVIGYYLERAGYKSTLVDIFRDQPMDYDFYLTHGMEHTNYCEAWRLFIPQGF